jgi:hypothetical protein
MERLGAISESLTHAYRVRQLWRTETEMRVSVLDDIHHPTPAAKYWQCIREQTVFLEQLALLSFEYRKLRVKRTRAERSHSTALDELDAEEHQITIDECAFAEANMHLAAEDRIREILLWEKLKNELIAEDPMFDRDNVDAHQLVSYTKRFILRAVHADTSNMPGGELDNLLGQLHASIRRCQETGLLGRVMADLPAEVAKRAQMYVSDLEQPRLN